MNKYVLLTAILVFSAANFGATAQAQNPQSTTVDPVIGWNLTETDLRTMKLGDLFLKAGGEPALNRIQAKANAPGGQFGMFVKKSKQDNIAPLLMGIANRLGYFTGKTAEAEKYYYKVAADLGNFRAMEELARLTPEVTESLPLIRKAAEAGYPGSMNTYGTALAQGYGVAQDNIAALNWFRKSSEMGNTGGTYNVGGMYYRGDGVAADKNEAIKWFQRAADAGHPLAMQILGKMYVDGDGVPPDRARGIKLLRNAATAGSVEAKNQLVEIDRAQKERHYAADVAAGRQSTAVGSATGVKKCGIGGWMGITCLDRVVVQSGTSVIVEHNQTIAFSASEKSTFGKLSANEILLACVASGRSYYLSPVFIEKFFNPSTGKPMEQWWTGVGNRGTCDPSKGRFKKVSKF